MNEGAGDIATTLEGVGSVRDAGVDTRTSVALIIACIRQCRENQGGYY